MSGSLLFSPDGRAISSERTEMHWPLEFMRMLAIFARNCEDGKLGIVCTNCKQALQGQNAREDNFWRMECACRTYSGKNPLPTAGVMEQRH